MGDGESLDDVRGDGHHCIVAHHPGDLAEDGAQLYQHIDECAAVDNCIRVLHAVHSHVVDCWEEELGEGFGALSGTQWCYLTLPVGVIWGHSDPTLVAAWKTCCAWSSIVEAVGDDHIVRDDRGLVSHGLH